MKKPAETRRTFLKKTVIAAPLVLSAKTLARGAGHVSPNERVRIGLIGCGGRSRAVVGAGLEWPEFQMVAVADCFEPKTREAVA